jgi:hypothetical protein
MPQGARAFVEQARGQELQLMTARRRYRALPGVVIASLLCACSASIPGLRAPEAGDTVCHQAGGEDAHWFGSPLRNVTERPITLTGARLGDANDATLLETVAIPEITQPNGDHLLLGTAGDLEKDEPELWAVHQKVAGFKIQPGQNAAVGFRITRSNGQDTADVTTQTITYRADGAPTEHTVTSRLRLIITADCDTVE